MDHEQFWSKTLNLSDDQYIEFIRGPKRLDIEFLIPFAILYIVVFFIGLLGNILLTIAILCNNSLYSPTNFYIITLSITDIALLILGLPLDFYLLLNWYPWPMNEAACMAKNLLSDIAAYTSVLVVVSLTIERYMAICHPFGLSCFRNNRIFMNISFIDFKANQYHDHPLIVIFISTLFGIILGYFLSEDNQLHILNLRQKVLKESAVCSVKAEESDRSRHIVIIISLLVTFVLPVVLLSFFYAKIIMKIKSSLREVRKFQRQSFIESKSSSISQKFGRCSSKKAPLSHSHSNKTSMANGHNNDSVNENDQHQKRKLNQQKIQALNLKRTIRVPIWVVISFFCCYAPFHLCRFLNVYDFTSFQSKKSSYLLLYHISGLCLYSISVANPILYNLLSKRFQRVFLSTFTRKRPWSSSKNTMNNRQVSKRCTSNNDKNNSPKSEQKITLNPDILLT